MEYKNGDGGWLKAETPPPNMTPRNDIKMPTVNMNNAAKNSVKQIFVRFFNFGMD